MLGWEGQHRGSACCRGERKPLAGFQELLRPRSGSGVEPALGPGNEELELSFREGT